jgi:hypothetical protein
VTGPISLAQVAAHLRAAATLADAQLAAGADSRTLAATLTDEVSAAEQALTALIGPTPTTASTPARTPDHPRPATGVEAPNPAGDPPCNTTPCRRRAASCCSSSPW